MFIDVSKYQGNIDWARVRDENLADPVNGVILRASTRNGALDTKLVENYNAILKTMSNVKELSVYKFSYARNYGDARVECGDVLSKLHKANIKFDYLYLDLENFDGRSYTTEETNHVITAYLDAFRAAGLTGKLRLYFNYDYLKRVIDSRWRNFPIWLARYNSKMGDTFGANVVLWQYTSTGKVNGINGNVDCSKEV